MNLEIFKLINNLANRNIFLDRIMIFFSKYVPYIFMFLLALVFISGVLNKNADERHEAFNAFILTVINLFLGFIIGSIYYEDRPFVHNKVNLLFQHVKDASFPSDHATGTMSIALGLKRYNRTLGRVMTILSIVVGFSRIYVGHHYPMDVIGAYAIVLLVSYVYNAKLRCKVDSIYDKIENNLISNFKKIIAG